MEKFCNIKCRVSGLSPDATVIVATTRALKMHGGGPEVTPGKPLHETYTSEDLVILKEGCQNLVRHVQNSKKFGIKVLVAINRFACVFFSILASAKGIDIRDSSDTPAELELIRQEALAGGADAAIVSNHWAEGGAGARALAEAVIATCEGPSDFKFLYDLDQPITDKISTIAKEIYGADGIELSELAQTQVDTYTRQGYGNLPSRQCTNLGKINSNVLVLDSVCMAKTQYSFSHDAKLKNVPKGYMGYLSSTEHSLI